MEDKEKVPDYLGDNIVFMLNEKTGSHDPVHWEIFQAGCGNKVMLNFFLLCIKKLIIFHKKKLLEWYDEYFKQNPCYGGPMEDGKRHWGILEPPPVNCLYAIYGITTIFRRSSKK